MPEVSRFFGIVITITESIIRRISTFAMESMKHSLIYTKELF